MRTRIEIVLASDANYWPGLEVTKASIERSCREVGRIAWHVFGEEDLAKVDVSAFAIYNTSKMPYLRLWLPELLPELDWVVYSDVDTIWNRDVAELWDAVVGGGLGDGERGMGDGERGMGDGEEKSIWWVRDFRSMREVSGEWIERVVAGEQMAFDWTKYACSGVCVMNLRKMREQRLSERAVEIVRKYGSPRFADQDVLNVICNGDCEMISSVWNAMGDCNNLPSDGARCVYHITGVGRHFHDRVAPLYPPQYQLWWNVRNGVKDVHWRSRVLALWWPLHGLARWLPLKLRERVVRQWFFAKVVHGMFEWESWEEQGESLDCKSV